MEAPFKFEPIDASKELSASRSPWGPDDHIGRLNWITDESRAEIMARIDGAAMFDLSVECFIGMPAWTRAGDPKYDIWMTHTPDGSVNDGLNRVSPEVQRVYSSCGDSIAMTPHAGTHLDTLNHIGYHGRFWNGWRADRDLGSRHWLKGGAEHYPPIVARGVMLDIAGLHKVECLPDSYEVTPGDLRAAAREQAVELRRGDVVLIRKGRMARWPDPDGFMLDSPGLGLAAAKYLCEEAGAMCLATDTIALEVLPPKEPDTFLPVHAYLLAAAGAQIIEIVQMEELAAERVYEFAFLGFPLRLRGATGAPMRIAACPLRD